jgi:hypothetical protein
MDAQFGVVLPLWSYAADRGALLDRVHGEVGIDFVTVPVITGEQACFRLCAEPRPADADAPALGDEPYFHTGGGWHFPPAIKIYSVAGSRPVKARWFGATDVLARLREHADRLRVPLVMRIELRAVRALSEHEPHLGQRNAWGQEVPSAGLCVCNPGVRELLRATLDDLGRYEPAGFELADWMPDHAMDCTRPRPLDWHWPTVRRLLDICFCPACRQIAERAGVEPDLAARSVRVRVRRVMGAPLGPEPAREADAVVTEYCAARVADCGQWLRRLAQADAQRVYRLLDGPESPAPYSDVAPVERLHRPAAVLPLKEDRLQGLLRVQALAGFAGWSLPVWRPCFNVAARLVAAVSEAVHAGVRIFDFEGLDEAVPDAVAWLKQAVRFARRG